MYTIKTLVKIVLLLCYGLAFASNIHAEDSRKDTKVLFGEDNRQEIRLAPANIKQLSGSVAALISRSSLKKIPAGRWEITHGPTGKDKNWCATEAFRNQPTTARCTAFLIGSNRIATSAHCVKPDKINYRPGLDCGDSAFLFGYELNGKAQVPNNFLAEQVFQCKQVIDESFDPLGADWSIIELDRVVKGYPVLDINPAATVGIDDELIVVGYPAGLPMKFADDAKILEIRDSGYALADLDTYAGNSGSPVFVKRKSGLQVIGLLSRGSEDFEIKSTLGGEEASCEQSRVCTPEVCGGEHVTLVSKNMVKE